MNQRIPGVVVQSTREIPCSPEAPSRSREKSVALTKSGPGLNSMPCDLH